MTKLFLTYGTVRLLMLGISAAQLRMNMIQVNSQALSHPSQTYLFSYLTQCPIIKLLSKQAGIINCFEFPLMMDDIAEKTIVFKVK